MKKRRLFLITAAVALSLAVAAACPELIISDWSQNVVGDWFRDHGFAWVLPAKGDPGIFNDELRRRGLLPGRAK